MSVVDPERDFADFVSRNEQALRGVVAKRLLDTPSDIDDAMQEGLVEMWRQFPSFPKDSARRGTYAGQVLGRASIHHMRDKWGRNLQRRNLVWGFDYSDLDREDDEVERDRAVQNMHRVIARMDEELVEHGEKTVLFERRLNALQKMLPALKPLEREVLLAHHPAGGNRRSPEVARHMGLSHSQVRQLYMEAMATLRPLLAHALAPELEAEEAGRVTDYLAGTMTDKRQRGRMKRHLKHCAACRALAASQGAVIDTGARLILPIPGMLGLVTAAGGTTAAGTAAVAGGTGGGGAVLGGGGALGGLIVKTAVGAAALTAAAGGYSAVEHRPAHPVRHVRQAAADITATPTQESTEVAAAQPTVAQTAEPATTPAAAPSAAPTASPSPSPAPESGPTEPPPVGATPVQSTASVATPPPHQSSQTSKSTSKSFAQEFGP